nr:sp110 nuclear body protein isoform X10 [Oryctolagus cuniculus]XP_051705028.1 sp110 nuclear body protein isoform X11 [Oryctolagus cuniculus]
MPTLPAAWNEALLQHFTCRKLEIAYAIHKPFPFFEGLRDKAFITERMYTESLEACRNLVPVSRVVYNVLTRLEQTFSLQLLEALFSQINLREYPRLAAVLRSFRGACASHGEWSRPTVVLLEGPPDPAEGSRLQTLLPLPAPPPPPPSCLPTAHRGSEPGGSSASTSESLPGPTVGGRSTPVTSDSLTSRIDEEEDPQELPSPRPSPVQVVRDDSPEPSDPEEPGEALSPAPNKKRSKRKRSIWSTPKKRHRKTSLPRASSGIQEKLPVVDQATHRTDGPTQTSGVMTRAQKARAECAQVSRPEEELHREKERQRERSSIRWFTLADGHNDWSCNGPKPGARSFFQVSMTSRKLDVQTPSRYARVVLGTREPRSLSTNSVFQYFVWGLPETSVLASICPGPGSY